ncbi:hypothetical protein [Micromonospora sp. NPDC047730]|uniref:hypothetical protein n=1 Tax=Micromonospora sp. NPDC047730 TaxID=3364253 RepID=UPI00371E1060
MTDELEETEEQIDPDELIAQAARDAAPRYGLDPDDFARRVLAQRDRRKERASRPAKECSDCREHLPARMFAEDAARPDGLQRYCKRCASDRVNRSRRMS